MITRLKEKPKYCGLIASGMALFAFVWSCITPLYSKDIDNYFMAAVLQGNFSETSGSSYINYLHPILCVILQGLSRIFPSADVFTIFITCFLIVAVWCLSYLIAWKASDYFQMLVGYGLFFLLFLKGNVFHDNFTRQASVLSVIGMLILLFGLQHGNKKWMKVYGTIFFAIGYMWRAESAYICMPFLFIGIVTEAIKQVKHRQFKKNAFVRSCIFPFAVLLLLIGVKSIVDASPTYREEIAYDNARSSVVDFPLKPWEEIQQEDISFSQNDYDCIRQWILMDTEYMNTSLYEEMASVAELEKEPLQFRVLLDLQKRVLYGFMHNEHLLLIAFVAGVIFLRILFSRRSLYVKLAILVAFMGADTCFLLFMYLGRAIERVYISIWYPLLTLSCFLIWNESGTVSTQELEQERISERIVSSKELLRMVEIIAIFAILIINVQKEEFTLNQSVWTANVESEEKYLQESDEDARYIWSMQAFAKYPMAYYMEQGKLLPKDFLKQHTYAGAWTYGHAYFNRYLEQFDTPNPMRALLERENTYYVSEHCEEVLNYLKEHYKEDVTAVQVTEIDGVPVWKFE